MSCKPCEARRRALLKAVKEKNAKETAKEATVGLLELLRIIEKEE